MTPARSVDVVAAIDEAAGVGLRAVNLGWRDLAIAGLVEQGDPVAPAVWRRAVDALAALGNRAGHLGAACLAWDAA